MSFWHRLQSLRPHFFIHRGKHGKPAKHYTPRQRGKDYRFRGTYNRQTSRCKRCSA